jgi:hypothetical protein
MQGAALRGELVDPEQLTRLANSATRIIGSLRRHQKGQQPNAPDAPPSSRPLSALTDAQLDAYEELMDEAERNDGGGTP